MPETTLSLSAALAGVFAILALLAEFLLIRSRGIRGELRVYALQSAVIAAFILVPGVHDHQIDLIVLAGATVVTKVIAVPFIVQALLRRTTAIEEDVPTLLTTPITFLLGVGLVALAFFVTRDLPLLGADLLASAFASALGLVLIGLLLMVVRPQVLAQLIGLLTVENGISMGSVAIAPQLPIILALLLLFDVLVAVTIFGVLIRLIAINANSLSARTLNRLRG
jgi:hydrogenase-4 component E